MTTMTATDFPASSAKARPRQPARSKRRVLIAGLLVLVVVAGTGAWWLTRPNTSAEPPATVTVSRGSVEETVLASGTLEASTLVSVGAQVSGVIKSVHVALGDNVKAGDLIAEIDSADKQNAVSTANAALVNVEAQRTAQEAELRKTQRALERARALRAKDLITDVDYDAAEAAVASSSAQLAGVDAQIAQAKITVQTAELDLERTRITAPANGTVVAVLVDVGQTVSAVQTAPTIAKIANLDTMLIKAEISEADVTRVEPGQKVYFTILGDPDNRIEATLRSVEPAPTSIESDVASTDAAIYYNGIFEVPNADHRLRISMTAQVTIVLAEAEDVLTLPASALGSPMPDGSYGLRVLDPATGQVRPARASVGLNNKVTAEIVSGLGEGDRVVTSGATGATAAPGGVGTRPGGNNPMGVGGPPPIF